MASNKKWIIASSITLVVLFGASIGVGAIIGTTSKADDSYIKIVVDGNEINVNSINLGDSDTSDSAKAKLLEEQFYSAALFGNFEQGGDSLTEDYLYGSSTEHKKPFVLNGSTTLEELQAEFVKVKFFNDTLNSSVVDYLNTKAASSTHPEEYYSTVLTLMNDAKSAGLNFPEVTGIQVLSNSDFAATRTAIYNTISQDSAYLAEIYQDMLAYTYLWQTPAQKAYDTIFTRELVYAAPSFVSSMELDASGLWADGIAGSDAYTTLTNIDSTSTSVSSTYWNGIFDYYNNKGIITDNSTEDNVIDFGSMSGLKGFDGIKFGTSAGSLIKNDWTDWDNTWDTSDGVTTKNGNYTNSNIVESANYYVSSDAYAPGEGAIIKEDTSLDGGVVAPDTGTATVYAYSQLYPYIFQTEKDGQKENAKYSLFANGDSSKGFTYDDSLSNNYIFDTWFGSNELDGEIYVAESLFGNKSTLLTSALSYWNNEGYYIELSGSYEADLASYLPTQILLDN